MINKIKNKYNQHKETIHNFIWRTLQVFGKQGIIFLIFILAAKLLIPYDFGIYNYILAIVFFLIMFGDFGISTATSKYVAEYNVTDKEKLKSVLFNSGLIILGLTIIISLITIFFGKFYLGDKYIYVLYLLPLIFLAPMTSLYDGIYRGLKKFKQLSIISVIVGLISLSFVYILIKQYGLVGALVAQNLFYFILFLALAIGYREFHFKLNKGVMKEIGKYAFIYGIAVFGYYLFSRIDILILGHFGYINEIATYELINKIFLILLVPFAIIGQVVAPNFARDYALKKYKLIYRKLKKYIILFIGIASTFALLTYLILPIGIKILLSEYYTQLFFMILYPCIIIYSIHVYVTAINAGIIVSTGYAKLMTSLNVILGIFNFILSLILLNLFGFIGVIYATLISHIIGALILHGRYYLKIKFLSKK
tara:strand:+ start:2195 stop:3463 length:1269 start_codon:yes stop_codon:yes gene_type:complete